MRPFRLKHSRYSCASFGSHAHNEPAVLNLGETAHERKNSGSPPASLLSSTQRVQAQPGGAAAEGASAYSHSALLRVFTVPWAGSRWRQLD